VNGLFVEY